MTPFSIAMTGTFFSCMFGGHTVWFSVVSHGAKKKKYIITLLFQLLLKLLSNIRMNVFLRFVQKKPIILGIIYQLLNAYLVFEETVQHLPVLSYMSPHQMSNPKVIMKIV